MDSKPNLSPFNFMQGALTVLGLVLLVVFGMRAMRQASSWEAVNGKPSLRPAAQIARANRLGGMSLGLGNQATLASAPAQIAPAGRDEVSQAPSSSDPGSLGAASVAKHVPAKQDSGQTTQVPSPTSDDGTTGANAHSSEVVHPPHHYDALAQ